MGTWSHRLLSTKRYVTKVAIEECPGKEEGLLEILEHQLQHLTPLPAEAPLDDATMRPIAMKAI